jgi:hypothetical protein
MHLIFSSFNNREKAIAIWITLILIWVFTKQDIRKSLIYVLKALFLTKLVKIFMAMIIYVAIILLLFSKIKLWNFYLIKEAIFWFLGSAFIMALNANKASQIEHYFQKLILDNLKLVLLFQFVVNLYSFNIIIEFILLPIIFIIVGMGVIAGKKREYLQAKRIIDLILSLCSISLFVYAFYKIVSNFRDFATLSNFLSFLLPILLTFAFVPFIYFFALRMAYEGLYWRLDFFLKNEKDIAIDAKRKIFSLCLFSLKRINYISKAILNELYTLEDKKDLLTLINKCNKMIERN